MIILALLIHAPLRVIAATGLVIIFGHNLLDYIQLPKEGIASGLISVSLSARGAFFPFGDSRMVAVLYSVLPWTGALLLGYAFGMLYKTGTSAQRRKKILLVSGISLSALFVVLRLVNGYGDPSHWAVQRNAAHTILSFLNATKQPPSLLFLSMTLGPMLIFLSFAENIKGWFFSVCEVYGNVPYFYFVIHFCLIRTINIALILIQGMPIKFTGYPLVWQAEGFGYPLWVVFLLWLLVPALLYFPCKWYGSYKRTHKQWWLSYL